LSDEKTSASKEAGWFWGQFLLGFLASWSGCLLFCRGDIWGILVAKDALNDSFVVINDILGVSSLKLGPQETFFWRFRV